MGTTSVDDELQDQIYLLEDRVLALTAAFSALVNCLEQMGLPPDDLNMHLSLAATQLEDDGLPGAAEYLDQMRALYVEPIQNQVKT